MAPLPDNLSLRAWLAGQALAGVLAAHADVQYDLPHATEAAEWAVGYADALLEALSSPLPPSSNATDKD